MGILLTWGRKKGFIFVFHVVWESKDPYLKLMRNRCSGHVSAPFADLTLPLVTFGDCGTSPLSPRVLVTYVHVRPMALVTRKVAGKGLRCREFAGVRARFGTRRATR